MCDGCVCAPDQMNVSYPSTVFPSLAVVGLHGNVFKPHTGTKTSVLFVQKWDDELCPKKEDYPIFFATMQKPSKDNSGEKIYVKDPITGEMYLIATDT